MYTYEDYLMHYGVAGQKWGVRNYQNYDGSLTEEGRDHYGYGDGYGDGGSGNSASSGASGASANSTKASNAVSAGEGKKSFDKEKLKKAAMIGGAVAATVLATYGAYKLSQLNGERNDYEGAGNFARNIDNIRDLASIGIRSNAEAAGNAIKNSAAYQKLSNAGQLASIGIRSNAEAAANKIKGSNAYNLASIGLRSNAEAAGNAIKTGAANLRERAEGAAANAMKKEFINRNVAINNIQMSPAYQKATSTANRMADNAALRLGNAAISARNAGNAGLDMAKRAGGAISSAYNNVADKAGRAVKSAQLSATLGSTQRADNKFQARLNKVDNIYNDTKRLNKVDAAYRNITQKDLNRTLGPIQRAENRQNARDLASIALRSNAEYAGNAIRTGATNLRNQTSNLIDNTSQRLHDYQVERERQRYGRR